MRSDAGGETLADATTVIENRQPLVQIHRREHAQMAPESPPRP